MNKLLLTIATVVASWLPPASSALAQSAAGGDSATVAPVDDTLFRTLGGQPGINRIVADFVPRLVTDARTAGFFKKTDQEHLKLMLAQQICVVSGGACVYTGLPMKLAHRDMDISRRDFNALVEILQASMDAQGVQFSTQNQLLSRLAPMHRDIIDAN